MKVFRTAVLALAVCGAPAAAWAQDDGPRSVVGVVRDEGGRPLPDAQVVLAPLGRTARTDAEGGFAFRSVPAGRHRVEASRMGHAPATREVAVAAGAGEVRADFVLPRSALSLPGLQVTATPTAGDTRAVTQATTQLSGRALEREMAGSVARTLSAQPGIAVRSMGPAAAVPVIRGLTGDRILVLQDGQRTADLAGSADDHGTTIDPLAAQRVEVVRGPATLLYGNNALGGVVNVISGDVPSAVPSGAEWAAAVQTESAYPGGAASLRASVPLGGGWAATLRAGARRTAEMRIGDDPVLGDRLDNSWTRSRDGSLGVSHVGEWGTGGVALRGYRFRYGLPVPPGSDPVSLRGHRGEVLARGEAVLGSGLFPSLRAEAGAHDYAHDELDSAGRLAQRFALRTGTAGLLLRQGRVGPFSEGAWGVSALVKRYAATGPAALTPAASSRGVGVFGFEEVELVEDGPALQVGGRWDDYAVRSGTSPKFGPGRERSFRALSGSVGLRVPLPRGISLGLSLARSFRAPTVEELFSGAPHAGTGSVELGNPELEAERGRSVEGVVGVRSRRWNGQFAAYHNRVSGYVHLALRGDTVVDGARLPVLVYAQDRATLRGVEGSVEWEPRRHLVLGAMGDYLHAERADGTPLSFMPPARLGGTLRWDDGTFSMGGDVHHELRQDRVGAAEELPTPAHTVFRAHAGFRFTRAGAVHSVTLRGENLTDELHREATSRIKDFAPGPGRNLAVVYRVFF